jgi:hypothetical protein
MSRVAFDEREQFIITCGTDAKLCQVDQCSCGATVDRRGLHVFSCKCNPGRAQRHHFINDLIWRAMTIASILSVKEPHGITRSDGKRPDSLRMIPWSQGRSATWDVTVTDTVAASYIAISST